MPSASLLSDLNHRHTDSSVSTNSELIQAIQDGSLSADTAQLLTADSQSAGRGQRERSWQSPRGNVYLSLYHPIAIPISGLLSLVIGVELAKMPIIQTLNEQLQAQGLAPIGVKWANDLGFYKTSVISGQQTDISIDDGTHKINNADQKIIYFNKLAGILIEPVWRASKLVGVVMGVGLNMQATPELTAQTLEGMSYQAISLQDVYQLIEENMHDDKLTGLPSLAELYEQVSQALLAALHCFEQLAKEKKALQTSVSNDFMHQFNQLDALSSLRLQVTQNHNGEPQIIMGHAHGIDTQGCLQLRQDNGKICALFTGRIDVIDTL